MPEGGGVGKARPLLEFRRALAQAEEQATWLEGRCISFGQSIPFLPSIDQYRENFSIEESDGEPEIIAKVEHGMRRMGELEAPIPYIRYQLGADPPEPLGGRGAPDGGPRPRHRPVPRGAQGGADGEGRRGSTLRRGGHENAPGSGRPQARERRLTGGGGGGRDQRPGHHSGDHHGSPRVAPRSRGGRRAAG